VLENQPVALAKIEHQIIPDLSSGTHHLIERIERRPERKPDHVARFEVSDDITSKPDFEIEDITISTAS
jgi:hypothetical protein